ncbi:MAG: aminotransferase class I/II-fold pyridoxal phosphate-dependent enzyme [Saprospiraceae bacterium]|nr:aminotransferase class I/II-fold pyridoxal phosphate-dependent enzyme [Candidatus Brachybacter algidus]MBL0120773.1 aminotransferase class I/II-fold pyridoxal phosphate-dependent enzyme [Candidatus Brachybacter algidus]
MEEKHFETNAIRAQFERSENNEHSVPLYLTSSFVFDEAEDMRAAFNDESDAFIYSRYINPNNNEFINKVCLMEGAEAGFATASGMAAIFTTFMSQLSSGDHVISCSSVFGATHAIFNKYFPKWNISYSYFHTNDVDAIESLIRPTTKFIYLETPTNPAIELIDLALVNAIAKKHNLLLIVDNCFATPYLQQPIKYGADLVIHSATKYMDGQGRVLGGIVAGRADLVKDIYLFGRLTGPSLSPFNSWVLSKSLETLALRMERHCENALFVAQKLEGHSALENVSYPFLDSHPQVDIARKQMKAGGGIITITLKGGQAAASKFLDGLKMIKISPNLGDARSIATHPASSTHCKLTPEERATVGISDGLVRISIGLEHREDILNDLLQALSNEQ